MCVLDKKFKKQISVTFFKFFSKCNDYEHQNTQYLN